ncbi:Facilitated trehalose transporter Tret1 [Melipona quadrifasciata]|uniref:Facilitated trehalose transporter Tret1 n=1 Tax=Melipona quadrifasciata TaxID=166423 RepID=A0A0N0BH59_9HYME|nr:Facilitated trehalose transporter Tret1 [Melipona quadrifasciata]
MPKLHTARNFWTFWSGNLTEPNPNSESLGNSGEEERELPKNKAFVLSSEQLLQFPKRDNDNSAIDPFDISVGYVYRSNCENAVARSGSISLAVVVKESNSRIQGGRRVDIAKSEEPQGALTPGVSGIYKRRFQYSSKLQGTPTKETIQVRNPRGNGGSRQFAVATGSHGAIADRKPGKKTFLYSFGTARQAQVQNDLGSTKEQLENVRSLIKSIVREINIDSVPVCNVAQNVGRKKLSYNVVLVLAKKSLRGQYDDIIGHPDGKRNPSASSVAIESGAHDLMGSASLGGFALGISLGWNSRASVVLKNYLDATATEIGLIGGILNGGICVGAMSMPFVASRVSRTKIMFWTMPVLLITWFLMISHRRQKVTLLLIGRFLCGICGGASCVLTPIYVAEIASKEIRGRLLAFFQLLLNCGVMYAFYVAHAIDEVKTVWRYSAICGFACLSIAPAILLPESPLHYLSKDDELSAEKSLRWYRGDTYDVQHEISETKRLVLAARSTKISVKLLKNRRVLRSIATCFGVVVGQHVCGVNMMIFYALTLFDTSGSGELTGSEQTLVVAAVQILVSLSVAFLVDLLGRRILLTLSSLLMGLFLILLVAALISLHGSIVPSLTKFSDLENPVPTILPLPLPRN